jgi:Polyketide cyclase / dehydrase and lipid transport
MSGMTEIRFEADIQCSAEEIFDVIADFGGQDRWLSESSAYRGTSDISDNPVVLGTSYRELVPLGVRNGSVTEFERPTNIAFDEPMTMKLKSGVVALTVRYTLVSAADSTHVTRTIAVGVPGRLTLFRPFIMRAVRVESERTLEALKGYADTLR